MSGPFFVLHRSSSHLSLLKSSEEYKRIAMRGRDETEMIAVVVRCSQDAWQECGLMIRPFGGLCGCR